MESETKNITDITKPDNGKDGYVIEVDHLKKSFGKKSVLKDVSIKLAKGENLVILGKSGTGKSVLIKCIIKLLEADEGKLTVLGEDITELEGKKLNELRKKIGFLFQSAALYDSMSVRENLEFPLRELHGSAKDDIDKRVEEALKNVDLLDVIDLMPSELSGGMRKRIGLARTLILNPEIVFYDEPTTGLDPITSREISNLILDVQKKYNAASIIITHDIACARITADRVIVMNEGKCIAEGSMEDLEKSKDPFIQSFFKQ